jgi:beta-glucosidase-like glycosyl hydrolase
VTAEDFRNRDLPVVERVDDLLARMTLEEKVAQLTGIMPLRILGPDGLDRARLAEHLGDGIGQLSMVAMLAPDDPGPLVSIGNEVQRFLVEETRLGIPAILHNEALSGLMLSRAADFPTAMALAATWDPEIVAEVCDVTRRQMRALGIRQALAPVLDVARDARWGRIHETYGEDPYLCAAIGVAFVQGLQGDDLRQGVLATAKHFIGYGAAEGGRNLGAVHLGERELYEVYARPFEAAMRVGGLQSVMNAYSDLNGEPVAASRSVLTDLLRGRLGFEGFVVSDYWAVDQLVTRQFTAPDPAAAAVQALRAGLDVELPDGACYLSLAGAVTDGLLELDVLDTSVRRVLTAKFGLGLFEDPYADPAAFAAVEDPPAHRALAHRVATRSMVLLENEGGLLPLDKDLRVVAVIGPSADSVRNLFGAYTPAAGAELQAMLTSAGAPDLSDPSAMAQIFSAFSAVADRAPAAAIAAVEAIYPSTPTVLDAIRAAVSATTEVLHARGCEINDPSTDGIAEAVAIARRADVVVLVVGDKTGWAFDAVSGEGRDRASLELPGAQPALVAAVCATGVPVVAVLLNSRPMPIGRDGGTPAAVLEAWLPGSVGGTPIAAVLFGDASPSGRLPITIPRTAGQCPIFHGHRTGSGYSSEGSAAGHSYTDLESGPAYPFGHGLSYTTFEYRRLTCASPTVDVHGLIELDVQLVNTGARGGDEVVQLYARIQRSGVTRPVRELVGFQRVHLEASESASVRFTVDPTLLAYVDVAGSLVLTPGPVELMAGGSSSELPLRVSVELVGGVRELDRRTEFFSSATSTRL